MAAQDADLVSPYTGDFSFKCENVSIMTVFSTEPIARPDIVELDTTYLVDGGAFGGSSITYVMRGYDTTLTAIVYWESSTVDPTGANYAGPGPVTDVVISSIK